LFEFFCSLSLTKRLICSLVEAFFGQGERTGPSNATNTIRKNLPDFPGQALGREFFLPRPRGKFKSLMPAPWHTWPLCHKQSCIVPPNTENTGPKSRQ